MTASTEAPGESASATSLNPPSMSKALASARRSIQNVPNRRSSGHDFAGPDVVDVLGRERDADDRQAAQPAVDDGADLISERRAGWR